MFTRQAIQSVVLLILYEYGVWALQCGAIVTKFVSLDQLRLGSE